MPVVIAWVVHELLCTQSGFSIRLTVNQVDRNQSILCVSNICMSRT